MQLETMQYFDETMSGAPDPATATPADVLKWALIDEKVVEYKSYDSALNQITFEEKHGMTEHTIYTFSDKTSRIRSFIDIIDEKTVQVVRNIMHLQDFEISIESEKYSYVVDGGDHRFTQASSGVGLEFGNNERAVAEGSVYTYSKSIIDFKRYRVLVSEDSLAVAFESNNKWRGYLVSYVRSRKFPVFINFYNVYLRKTTFHYVNSSGKIVEAGFAVFYYLGNEFNKLMVTDVFEIVPCTSTDAKATFPRILNSWRVGRQKQSETVFYADDTRVFMWETENDQAILLAVGGRDVTAFK